MSPVKSLLLHKNAFTAGCIPYMHMAYFCTWHWIWQKQTWKFCVELLQRAVFCVFGFYAVQWFWGSGNWFSTTSLKSLAFSWNFYLLCIKLVGLLPCLNISPVDKMILEIWVLLLSQKSDDEYIYYLITILSRQKGLVCGMQFCILFQFAVLQVTD